MKTVISIALFSIGVLCQPAFAALPRSAVTSMKINLYGMYTTADATCQTGLVPTIPLTATPTVFDLVQNPAMGSGSIANPINCVVFVMQNQVNGVVAPGTYTTTTNGNPDSVCNGGATQQQVICKNNGGPTTVGWPAQIVTDAAALGLTRQTSCSTSNGVATDVVAIYLSTYSVCTGHETSGACSSGNNNFMPPTAANDSAHGFVLTAPTTTGDFKLVIDPDQSYGSNSGACGNANPPLFSFKAI